MRAIFPPGDEERLKEEFFAGRRGYFVDVGANDPREGSQTWHLEQLGWDGVLIEPQQDLAERLRRERRAKVFAEACSAPQNAGKTMVLHIAGIQTSLNPDFYVADMRRTGTTEVPVRTLDNILTEAQAPAPLDIVSNDVESHEIEVLQGFDLARWQPRLILIEDLAFNLRIHRHLAGRGYKWVRRTGINGWYVPQDSPMRVSATGRLQFIRKHYLGVPFRNFREWKRKLRGQ